MKKTDRQRLIKQLLKEHRIQKQEEFVDLLIERGIDVTQATISRDIKEMQLIKVSNEDGSFHYSLSNQKPEVDDQKLSKMLDASLVSLSIMDKMVVIKTIPGSGAALGQLIEKLYEKLLFTSLATDDKVLMIFREENQAIEIHQQLNVIIYER
ncbi:ArgR family transcriptional regulator [Vagococcus sp. BWB3-3]|uniref:Arginine repressor n=1 Tax=Vagococcus allomyrinae TaxID=2794353 RepID=A0A940PET6_9ENTE|nr:ArgR family transcriptional regulator [Vagococcus allomyrinae]MBP1041513.1 ArgR family transcriptional regulator [Vagococcus allomyrinae]